MTAKAFTNTLYSNDNLFILNGMNSNSVDLIYLDPPFNTKRMYSAPVGSKAAGASFKDMWRCPIETMRKLEEEGKIFYTKNGISRRKRYLDETKGIPAQDDWFDIQALRSWHKERTGYPTQKPLALLHRIIKASSNEGDRPMEYLRLKIKTREKMMGNKIIFGE